MALISISAQLRDALLRVTNPAMEVIHRWDDFKFRTLIGSIGRLPIYTFDDEHPFKAKSLSLIAPSEHQQITALLASFYKPFHEVRPIGPGSFSLRYEGDGVTRSFDLSLPAQASFPNISKRSSS
jgi:hypothetical protein